MVRAGGRKQDIIVKREGGFGVRGREGLDDGIVEEDGRRRSSRGGEE